MGGVVPGPQAFCVARLSGIVSISGAALPIYCYLLFFRTIIVICDNRGKQSMKSLRRIALLYHLQLLPVNRTETEVPAQLPEFVLELHRLLEYGIRHIQALVHFLHLDRPVRIMLCCCGFLSLLDDKPILIQRLGGGNKPIVIGGISKKLRKILGLQDPEGRGLPDLTPIDLPCAWADCPKAGRLAPQRHLFQLDRRTHNATRPLAVLPERPP